MTPLLSTEMGVLREEIRKLSNKVRALASQRFFKTGKGEYGEGDRFLGLDMKSVRQLVRLHRSIDEVGIEQLLRSKWHEERMIGFLMLVDRYERSCNDAERKHVLEFFLSHRSAINNWDLVDATAPRIPGDFVLRNPRERSILQDLFDSSILWDRRIAVLATFPLIRSGQFGEISGFAERTFEDRRDLIQKSVGWMLREVGKQDESVLIGFLNQNAARMPRTMLRYSIERLSPEIRQGFLMLTHV